MSSLAKIRNAGFDISLNGHNLTITPFSKLSPNQLAYLKTHKSKIIQGLKQEQATNDSKAPGLAAHDEKAIRTWLGHIGEADPSIIHEVLDKCRTDLEALAYFLSSAKSVPTPRPDPDDDRHFCRECQNLIDRAVRGKPDPLPAYRRHTKAVRRFFGGWTMNLRTLTNEALWHLWRTHISIAATIKAELDHRDRVFKPRRNQRSSSRPFNNKHGKRT